VNVVQLVTWSNTLLRQSYSRHVQRISGRYRHVEDSYILRQVVVQSQHTVCAWWVAFCEM